MKKEHFEHFHLAGFSYYEGAIAFEQLKIGGLLQLKHEPNNTYDKYAVEIYHNEFKLGHISRTNNKQIAKLLMIGNNCFETRIQWVDPQSHPVG